MILANVSKFGQNFITSPNFFGWYAYVCQGLRLFKYANLIFLPIKDATLPKLDAGHDGVDPVLGLVIKNHQILCSCGVRYMGPLTYRGLGIVQCRGIRNLKKERDFIYTQVTMKYEKSDFDTNMLHHCD